MPHLAGELEAEQRTAVKSAGVVGLIGLLPGRHNSEPVFGPSDLTTPLTIRTISPPRRPIQFTKKLARRPPTSPLPFPRSATYYNVYRGITARVLFESRDSV